MAKKKTQHKAKSFSEALGFEYLLNNTITDFFLGLILFFAAVYVIIAMVSFLNTGAADQSILEDLRQGEWTNTGREFQNYCGSLGAIISYWLMSVNFGFPAFLLPLFCILVGFQLMHAYKINLLKWFLCMMVVMLWSSVTFAKLLTPLMGNLIFNPGGKHGLFVVQRLEDIMGPPGLTAILLIVAVAFLTFLTTETITVIRKALNPIGYISKKVSFEITNHTKDDQDIVANETVVEQEETEEAEDDDIPSTVLEEFYDPEPAKVIDLDVTQEESLQNEENLSDDNADQEKSLLERQRELRAKKAEQETKEAVLAASDNIDMDISVATANEKAKGLVVSNTEQLNTPINPKEPFTKYKYPTLNLLKKYEDNGNYIDEAEQIANKNRIIEVLGNFGVTIRTIRATVGPTITLYEIQPAEGVRISKIKNLEDDIALSLAALGIRIIAPIPGKGTIGIEVPNAKPNIVSMESILNSRKFQETKMELPIALGKTITNEVFMVDLAKIPHLLVAGATGQGKSVGLNAIITS